MFRMYLLVVALYVVQISSVSAQTNNADVCVVESVEGRAMVWVPGTRQLVAEIGLGLPLEANLKTDDNARVSLLCRDTLNVVVGASTEIRVYKLVPGGRQPIALRLLKGIAGFIFDSDEDDGVQVRTPSAVAAIRSTEWAMRVQNDSTAVFARDGSVYVLATGGDSVSLGPGDGIDITASGDMATVVQWGQSRIDLFSELLGPEW